MTIAKDSAIFSHVLNRGTPPARFLVELLDWARSAPDSLFEENSNPADIYALIRGTLGPWEGLTHRKAALLEVMRVHAGFESSWDWSEGVDTTNHTSMAHIEGQETGVFQVSFDSLRLSEELRNFAQANGISTPRTFLALMKSDHQLALTYYAMLVRANIRWAGPLVRREILPLLSREAVAEFRQLLTA